MKKLLWISILIITLSCGNSEKNTIVENDRFELIPEPDKELREQYSKGTEVNEFTNTIDSLVVANPVETINRVFTVYNQYDESTDSRSNLDSLRQSFKQLVNSDMAKADITLIINVWMYYTVTDFDTRKYTESILLAHKEKSIEVLRQRMKNPLDWETEDSAPYSELSALMKKLEKN